MDSGQIFSDPNPGDRLGRETEGAPDASQTSCGRAELSSGRQGGSESGADLTGQSAGLLALCKVTRVH